jgi:hypothetical protein
MSMTISTIAAEARPRSKSPVEVLFRAVSSSLGPVRPDAISSLAFATGFAYSTNDLSTAAPLGLH